MERQFVGEQEEQSSEKGNYYTHAIVSYASLEEIQPLLKACKHWAYIFHDRDIKPDGTQRSPHFHIVATFVTAKSFKNVTSLVISTQNTFSQPIKSCVGNVMTYFTHQTHEAIKQGKEPYSDNEVILDNEEYWRKRALQDGDSWKEEKGAYDKNETFIDDLLSTNLSVETMGRKYGRDFIKNRSAYLEFREQCFQEAYYDMAKQLHGVPEELDIVTGEIQTIHAILTRAEYQMIMDIRFSNKHTDKKGIEL